MWVSPRVKCINRSQSNSTRGGMWCTGSALTGSAVQLLTQHLSVPLCCSEITQSHRSLLYFLYTAHSEMSMQFGLFSDIPCRLLVLMQQTVFLFSSRAFWVEMRDLFCAVNKQEQNDEEEQLSVRLDAEMLIYVMRVNWQFSLCCSKLFFNWIHHVIMTVQNENKRSGSACLNI